MLYIYIIYSLSLYIYIYLFTCLFIHIFIYTFIYLIIHIVEGQTPQLVHPPTEHALALRDWSNPCQFSVKIGLAHINSQNHTDTPDLNVLAVLWQLTSRLEGFEPRHHGINLWCEHPEDVLWCEQLEDIYLYLYIYIYISTYIDIYVLYTIFIRITCIYKLYTHVYHIFNHHT